MPKADNAFGSVRGFVLDMDGTTYLGDRLLPGAQGLLNLLDEREIPYLFLTNNSSRRADQYALKLQSMGLKVQTGKILTSGEATALYLGVHYPGSSIYVVGTEALEEEFTGRGFALTERSPDVVVLGFDTELTYRKLWRLCDFVRAGLPYVATHPDLNCPVAGGFMPDIGAMISFVEASTGRRPDVIVGKPHAPIVAALSERLGLLPQAICVVGDRLYTDIALGSQGMVTVLVLSGEAQREDLAHSAHVPDVVVRDLIELSHFLEGVCG